MDKLRIPRFTAPNVALPPASHMEKDGLYCIEFALAPYILPSAAWSVSTGRVYVPGNGSIAVVPIPEGAIRMFYSRWGTFPANTEVCERFIGGDGGARLYANHPRIGPNLYRTGYRESGDYIVDLDGSERFYADYTKIHIAAANFDCNATARIRFYSPTRIYQPEPVEHAQFDVIDYEQAEEDEHGTQPIE